MNKKKTIILNLIIIVICILIVFLIYLLLKKDKLPPTPPTLTINDRVVNLYVGDEYTINYTFNNNDNNITLKWDVSNKSVLSINDNKVIALSRGISEVTVSYVYEDKSYIQKIAFIVDEFDKEAPIIKVVGNPDENTWVNHFVTLNIEIEDKSDYEVFYYLENGDKKEEKVINNTIRLNNDGTNIVHIKAIDDKKNQSEIVVKVNIDQIAPSCSLKFNDDKIEITKSDNIELSYFGTNKDYSGNNIDSIEAKEGTFNYYVKDLAGNTSSCAITIVKKTLYRKSTCTACNGCKEAGCNKYSDWLTTGTHCNDKPNANDYIGEYEKYTNCRYDTSCSSTVDTGDKERPDKFYRCTRAIRSCRDYKTSCEKCGCDSWSKYGEWTDKKIVEDENTKVQKQERLYGI